MLTLRALWTDRLSLNRPQKRSESTLTSRTISPRKKKSRCDGRTNGARNVTHNPFRAHTHTHTHTEGGGYTPWCKRAAAGKRDEGVGREANENGSETACTRGAHAGLSSTPTCSSVATCAPLHSLPCNLPPEKLYVLCIVYCHANVTTPRPPFHRPKALHGHPAAQIDLSINACSAQPSSFISL